MNTGHPVPSSSRRTLLALAFSICALLVVNVAAAGAAIVSAPPFGATSFTDIAGGVVVSVKMI